MARTKYGNTMKRFRRDIDKSINERLMRIGGETADKLSDYFVKIAQNKLLNYGSLNAKDSISFSKIQQIADSITSEKEQLATIYSGSSESLFSKVYKGPVVRIPIDKDKLVLFLEYGTGLAGKYSRSSSDFKNEASRFGWKYAVNDNTIKVINTKYGSFKSQWYPTIKLESGKEIKGFVFKRRANQYLDKNDGTFRNSYVGKIVKSSVVNVGETIMHSKYGKTFTRRAYSYNRRKITFGEKFGKKEFVVSRGLKPARFIYDSKNIMKRIIDECKKVDFEGDESDISKEIDSIIKQNAI